MSRLSKSDIEVCHEAGHAMMAGLCGFQNVMCRLEGGVYHILRTEPKTLDAYSPRLVVADLVSGMALEAVLNPDSGRIKGLDDLIAASQFGEYDIEALNDLKEAGVGQKDIDEVSRVCYEILLVKTAAHPELPFAFGALIKRDCVNDGDIAWLISKAKTIH